MKVVEVKVIFFPAWPRDSLCVVFFTSLDTTSLFRLWVKIAKTWNRERKTFFLSNMLRTQWLTWIAMSMSIWCNKIWTHQWKHRLRQFRYWKRSLLARILNVATSNVSEERARVNDIEHYHTIILNDRSFGWGFVAQSTGWSFQSCTDRSSALQIGYWCLLTWLLLHVVVERFTG